MVRVPSVHSNRKRDPSRTAHATRAAPPDESEIFVKQILIQRGMASVTEVPAPVVEPGSALVRVAHSCISMGTEGSTMAASAEPLWRRALRQPEKVQQVLQLAATQGMRHAWNTVQGKLKPSQVTGYSAAGVIVDLGQGILDLHVGQMVACAGAQCAHHAEYIRVPRNLLVPVPHGVQTDAASTVALGAIALQGIRRAAPTLGETFVVVGLGVVGQLCAQMLRANGCRVIGVDLDARRLALAQQCGVDINLMGDDTATEQVFRWTDGFGADGVLVCAATKSDAVISQAFQMCRKKGRVVLVGDVGLNLQRADFYAKEIDLLISTSYGPGRYDDGYEQEGVDYPIGYVRWTENRNMAAYLRLLATEAVRVAPLITKTYPVEEAETAYAQLQNPSAERPLLLLLSYPAPTPLTGAAYSVHTNRTKTTSSEKKLGIAVVGAGNFARGVHLPNLAASSDFDLKAIVCRTGHAAVAAARQFRVPLATTDFQQVLHDSSIDAVLIATRHDLHASQVLSALRAGKHVLVEKPLALTESELAEMESFFANDQGGNRPMLLTGFNRRFSPHAERLRQWLQGRTNPMIVNYRMNAGYLPNDHWVHGAEGGGRNRGEACHIYDLFTFLTQARVVEVDVQALIPKTGHYRRDDNFVATMGFADGSLATLVYTALGTNKHPKEQMELFFDGKVLSLNDYMHLEPRGFRAASFTTRHPEKGHREELAAFVTGLRDGVWPIPLWQQLQASRLALTVESMLQPSAGSRSVSAAA